MKAIDLILDGIVVGKVSADKAEYVVACLKVGDSVLRAEQKAEQDIDELLNPDGNPPTASEFAEMVAAASELLKTSKRHSNFAIVRMIVAGEPLSRKQAIWVVKTAHQLSASNAVKDTVRKSLGLA